MTPAGRGCARRGVGLLPLLFLAALLAFARPAAATGLFAAETFTLSNGLQVVVVESRRAPVVVQMLFYKAGNADAPLGKSGIAHFLEHLMFKGTPSFPEGELSRRVALMGGEDNAFTTEDYTAFHQTVASQHLADIMQMEADRMTNLALAEGQVDSERDVIIEERRQDVDNDPHGQLDEMMQASLFLNHPYRLPVLGWLQEMEGLTRADELDFYRRWYAPNNAVLVISGDTTAAEVRRLAEATYGKIPARAVPARDRVKEPTAFAPRRLTLHDPSISQASWRRYYLAPTYHEGLPRQPYAIDVLAEVLGGGPTSRLYRDLVVDKGVATSVGAYFDGNYLDYGRFTLAASPPVGGDPGKLEAAMDAALAKLLATGIDDKELAAAKAHLEADAIKARDGLMGPAQSFGIGLATGVSFDEIQSWRDRIAAVTSSDVMAAARKILHPETSATGELLPEAAK
jgi:zinc protease